MDKKEIDELRPLINKPLLHESADHKMAIVTNRLLLAILEELQGKKGK